MRIFGILLAIAFAMHFTPMEGYDQQNSNSTNQTDKKQYINTEDLYFENGKIFWQASKDNWVPLKKVKCDSRGIYLKKSGISWSYYLDFVQFCD